MQFNLPVEPELLESMLAYCDVDGDGQINYEEFANFLNWKDKMPSGGTQSTLKEETTKGEVKVRKKGNATSILHFTVWGGGIPSFIRSSWRAVNKATILSSCLVPSWGSLFCHIQSNLFWVKWSGRSSQIRHLNKLNDMQ